MWGDPKITTLVHLNGQTHNITVSLEAAFRHLRYQTEERGLWLTRPVLTKTIWMRKATRSSDEADLYLRETGYRLDRRN